MFPVLEKLRGGLVVSCQAHEQEPLHGPVLMAAMAYSAELGGAVGLRVNGKEDIELVRRTVRIPIIGILKVPGKVRKWITPTIETAKTVIAAGADLVAVHATVDRDFGDKLEDIVEAAHRLNTPVMADCGTLEDAIYAEKSGCDIIGTTLAHGVGRPVPDFDLLKAFVDRLSRPVMAEGGYWYPEQVVKAFELGVFSVTIGTAITRPREITRHFVEAIERFHKSR